MKYRWLSTLLLWGALAACQEEVAVFETSVPADGIIFVPVSGGAVMRYAIPENTDICALRVRYLNDRGEEMMKDGSIYTDSLLLSGFNAPQSEVTVRITVVDHNNVESEPLERTFSTFPSVAYAFADSIKVEDVWDGMMLKANYDGMPAGEMVDVFRVGINPFTKKQDTLYLANCKIARTVNQFVKVDMDKGEEESTIVVKTVDANGYYVRTRVFPGIKNLATEQYPRTNLAVSDPGGYSEERGASNDYQVAGKLGIAYLIDGDLKGEGRLGTGYNFCTYMTKPDAAGSYVVLTLKEPQVIASVRLYAMLHDAENTYPRPVVNMEDYLPSHVKVFGSNDMEQWDELAEFFQPNNSDYQDMWSYHRVIGSLTQENLDRADPMFMTLTCPVVDMKYKHVKVQCLDHFDYSTYNESYRNQRNVFTYQELEVYVQKD